MKTAVITGASRGIGKAVSIGLASAGYKTILIATSGEKLKSVAEQIESVLKQNTELYPEIFSIDITNFGKVNNTIDELVNKFGSIDVLVNNAGIWAEGSLEADIEEFQKVMDVNVTAQYNILKSVVPVMKKQKRGYIFNITSRGGKYGFPGSATYVASKFALVGISESLYRELAEYNVKVTSISPSWVNTDMAKETGGAIPEEEMIQPEDIMKTINWLLSLSPPVSIKDVEIECRLRIK